MTLIGADLAGSQNPTMTAGTYDQTSPEVTADETTAPYLIFDGGTLAPTADTTIDKDVSITNNGGTIDTTGGNTTLTGTVDGRGNLNKVGDNTLTLTGTNTNSGITNVVQGTLVNTGSLAGPVTNNATLNNSGMIDNTVGNYANGTFTNSGAVTGLLTNVGTTTNTSTGQLGAVTNTGTFNNAGDVSGLLTNNAGTTTNTGTLGNGATVNGGNLALDGGSLTGPLTINTGGTATLGANDVISNGSNVVVNGGTLAVGTNTDTVNGVSVRNNGTVTGTGTLTSLSDYDIQSGTVGANLAGNVGLNKTTAGIATLTGTNTYTGPTTISAGTLTGNIGSFGAGNIAVDTSANLVIDQATDGQFGNNVTGTGTLTKQGAGAVTLTGTNTYSGGTTITAGTLIGNTGNFGTGPITNNAALVFNQGTDGAFNNAITGTGALTKTGAGTLTLGGTNTYTGGTNVQQGTLAVTGSLASDVVNDAALNNTGAIGGTVTNNTTGNFANVGTVTGLLTTTGSATNIGTLSGGATVNAGTLALNGGSLSGDLAVNGGTATLGASDVISNSSNVIVNGGTFAIGGNSNTVAGVSLQSGALTGTGGTLTSLSDYDIRSGTASANLAGGVGLNKTTDGVAFLTGTNTYTGPTTISAGTLVGNSASFGTGPVTNNASLVFDQGTDGSFGQQIGGTGVLTKAGNGVLTLNGANTYTGGTNVQAGTLIGSTDSIRGPVVNNATVVFNQANDGTITDALSGSGLLVKDGFGTLRLAGSNTTTGGTAINAGTLVGSASNFGTGTIANNANLIIDQAVDGALGNAINGTGTLTKIGQGTLTYDGIGTLSGPTSVNAGQMNVNGSLANSAFTVGNGATLGGTGTIGGLHVLSGATAAPGAPGSQLNVAGNVLFDAGSNYRFLGNAAGQGSGIAATGSASLAGGTVELQAAPGTYALYTRYNLLSAAGGLSGQFASVTSNFAFLSPGLSYDANNAYLTLARNDIRFAQVAQTRNQAGVAGAAEALGLGNPIYNAIAVLSAPQAKTAFNALSGEVHANSVSSQMQSSFFMREAILDRLRQDNPGCGGTFQQNGSALDRSCRQDLTVGAAYAADLGGRAPRVSQVPVQVIDPRVFTLWGQGFGAWGTTSSDGNAASLKRQTSGFVIGGDVRIENTWRIGIAGGYSVTDFDVTGGLSSGKTESVYGALYGAGSLGAIQLRAGVLAGSDDTTTRRAVIFPGFSQSASANYGGTTVQGFGEIGYRFGTAVANIEPFLGGSVMRISRDRFTEEGGVSALTSFSRDYDLATTTVGIRGEVQLGSILNTELPISARALVGYRRAYGDLVPSALLSFAGTSQIFQTAGVPIDRDAFVTQAGFQWQVAPSITLGVDYTGQIAERAQDHGAKGNFTYRF